MLAAFSKANGFKAGYALTAPNARQDIDFLAFAIRREQHGCRASDRLRLRIAKHLFGALIPTGDDSVRRFADDGVVCRLHNGSQSFSRGFAAQLVIVDAYVLFG